MANINSREKIGSIRSEGSPEKKDSDKALREKAASLAEGVESVVADIESNESSEFSDGNVSEKAKGGKEKSGSSGGGSTASTSSGGAVYIEPTLEVMAIQVRTKLRQEIETLEKEYKACMKKSSFDPFHLTQIVSKIRKLKEILSELFNVTGEKIKEWWNEYVKAKS